MENENSVITEESIREARAAAPSLRPPLAKKEAMQTPRALADRYEFIEELGSGFQGHVYKARRLSDGSLTAIKQLRVNSVKNWKEYDLFARETAVLQSLNMPGVAKFYESIEALNDNPPEAYIVQELIEGRSLDSLIHSGRRFSLTQTFNLANQLLDILARLHQHNPPIIHRDIKPSNILLRPKGRFFEVYLIDFGAVANPQIQGGGSTVAGTYGYMPPEQLTGNPTQASDLYSLAATIVYILSGVSPASMEIADFRLIIDPHLENVPRCIVNVLQLMLEPDPTKRLTDITVLKQIFSNFEQERYNYSLLPSAVRKLLTASNKVSSKEINKLLKQFKYYGQDGSIDIWSALPEQTPRAVPKFYRTATPLTHIFHSFFKFLSLYFNKDFKGLVIAFFITFITTIIISSLIIFFTNFPLEDFYIYLIACTAIAFIICIIEVIFQYYFFNVAESFEKRIDTNNIVNLMIKYGRKTIATVIDVRLSDLDDTKLDKTHCTAKYSQFYYYNPVSIVIRYKFNPPDDSEEDDIIHEITTHYDVREVLKPGSPFPILYLISKDKKQVESMPYPLLPGINGTILGTTCITCLTNQGMIVNNYFHSYHFKDRIDEYEL